MPPCLLNIYAEYIMQNARLDESKTGIKISGEISTTSDMQMTPFPMAENKEELKNLLMKVKEESEKAGLKATFRKQRSWHLVPSLHGE